MKSPLAELNMRYFNSANRYLYIIYNMENLSEYHTLQSKEQFYNCIIIDTEQEFEAVFNHIKASTKDYVFRSVNEAKFKLYSSAQRQWIWNDLFSIYHSYKNYINSRITLFQSRQDIMSFFPITKFH